MQKPLSAASAESVMKTFTHLVLPYPADRGSQRVAVTILPTIRLLLLPIAVVLKQNIFAFHASFLKQQAGPAHVNTHGDRRSKNNLKKINILLHSSYTILPTSLTLEFRGYLSSHLPY